MTMTIAPFALSLSREKSVESNHSLAAVRRLSDMASVGFKGSSIRITSAPRPVKTPPTERWPGGSREPLGELATTSACGDASLVENSDPYHGTYAQDLSEKFARDCRAVMTS